MNDTVHVEVQVVNDWVVFLDLLELGLLLLALPVHARRLLQILSLLFV